MIKQKVVIINTGCANISSVQYAIERLGYNVIVSADADVIRSADKVLLPGVGHAAYAMQALHQGNLVELIQGLTQPVLGICLGMQMLAAFSEEGNVACLNLVDAARVQAMDKNLRLPHMGWNAVSSESNHPLFNHIDKNEYFYFVHSYAIPVGDFTIAHCDYGQPFSAAIQHNNFIGVQFHPERSGKAGAQLLKNFLEY